uniref:S1 RNA binding domain 1 n=1 Tax=Eptatretus burgeri TaxID=7764 RepID=A0A8C4QEC9_EPTBU
MGPSSSRIVYVKKKAENTVIKLEKEQKLEPALRDAILSCVSQQEVDHLVAPFKTTGKHTKAEKARSLGLEPAARAVLERPLFIQLQQYVEPSVDGRSTLNEVQTGVGHILADIIAKDKDTMEFIRGLCDSSSVEIESVKTSAAKKENSEKGKFSQHKRQESNVSKFSKYFGFRRNVHTIQNFEVLAMNRGEMLKVLRVRIVIPDSVKQSFMFWCLQKRWRPQGILPAPLATLLSEAVEDSYKRLISPLLCRKLRCKLTKNAEQSAIVLFGRNLRKLLLSSPMRGSAVLGADPGFKHGCKLAAVGPTGQLLTTALVFPQEPPQRNDVDAVRSIVLQHGCDVIAIGNGTACFETERFFSSLIQNKVFVPLDVKYCIVNEDGASIYSTSPQAQKEMPDVDPNMRSAVSIARRLQDPLAELIKIDAKHIGVGMYQHDVPEGALRDALTSVVQECVSFVGVDINSCSTVLLKHVAGLSNSMAERLVEYRETHGAFANREQLRAVKGLGPRTYLQCAGFIRVNPCTASIRKEIGHDVINTNNPENRKLGRKRKRGEAEIDDAPNPLDQTWIHPESYSIATKFLRWLGVQFSDIGSAHVRQKVESTLALETLQSLAEKMGTSGNTMQIIVDGLKQQLDFDIRTNLSQPIFRRNVLCFEDLRPKERLTGRVTNSTDFGVFVDVGIGKSGLIPKKYLGNCAYIINRIICPGGAFQSMTLKSLAWSKRFYRWHDVKASERKMLSQYCFPFPFPSERRHHSTGSRGPD